MEGNPREGGKANMEKTLAEEQMRGIPARERTEEYCGKKITHENPQEKKFTEKAGVKEPTEDTHCGRAHGKRTCKRVHEKNPLRKK